MAQPVRMCVLCRERMEKKLLTRYITRVDEKGESCFVQDPRHTMPGRGLYVCQKMECQKKFPSFRLKKKGIKKG